MRSRPLRASPRLAPPSRATAAALETAIRQIDVLKAELAQAQATLARRRGGAETRPSSISPTRRSSRRSTASSATARLRVGQYVQAGTQLMAVVPVAAAYIVANYKETQLTDVRPGKPVDDRGRHVPRRSVPGPRRQHRAGQRAGIRAAAARQRHRQLHQGGAAHPGQDRARRGSPLAARCVPACRSIRRSTPRRSRAPAAPRSAARG